MDECSRCHRRFNLLPWYISGQGSLCESCFEGFPACPTCETRYANAFRAVTCPCQYQYDDDNGDNDLIHHYSYRPTPEFHGAGPLYLGMELEVETDDTWQSSNTAVNALGSLAYLKEDGSVDGFEIVTHPMSYAYALAEFPWQLLPELADEGCNTHEGTGLHIHVSRNAFRSPCHIFRWHKLIYRNAGAVQALARRGDNEYASFGTERYDSEPISKGLPQSTGRYSAINAQNPDTFEMRMFKASLRPQEVQSALAFADASVRYTETLTSHDVLTNNGWAWQAFSEWVGERPEYGPLAATLDTLSFHEHEPVRRSHDSYRCQGHCYHCRTRALQRRAARQQREHLYTTHIYTTYSSGAQYY